MSEFIRVKCKTTGHEKSIRSDASREGWDVLDKPATQADGTPLPDKHNRTPKSLSSQPNPGPKADNPKGA